MRSRLRTISWIAGLLPALALPALTLTAQTVPTTAKANALPVYIEEFFLSEAVRAENRGELQFTTQLTAFRNHVSPEDGTSASLDIEYGFTNRFQISVELPYGLTATPASEIPNGRSTVSAGLLYQFIRSNRPFALSAGMGIDLPVNSTGETGYEPEILAAKAFGNLQLHATFAPEFSDDGNSYAYNLAALHPAPHHLIPTLEFNGRRNAAINTFYLTPGLYVHLPHRLEAGAGMPIGLGTNSSPIGAVIKVTWELGDTDDD